MSFFKDTMEIHCTQLVGWQESELAHDTYLQRFSFGTNGWRNWMEIAKPGSIVTMAIKTEAAVLAYNLTVYILTIY